MLASEKEIRKQARAMKRREARLIAGTPGKGMGYGGSSGALKKYQGVTVGGKKYTRFSQIPVTSAGKKTTKQRLAGGIKLAIL